MKKLTTASMLACGGLVLGSLLAAGCETTPEAESSLAQARAAVEKAGADANVARYSAAELERARNLLDNAESAAKEGSGGGQTSAHYAYLATQTARIAEQRAQEQLSAARIASGIAERQQILIESREAQAAQPAPRGMVLTLDEVSFDSARSELTPGAQRSIDQVAEFPNQNPERQMQVEGLTDAQGSEDFKLELSQSRVDAAASPGSRQLNRRVEVVVSNDALAIPGRQPR